MALWQNVRHAGRAMAGIWLAVAVAACATAAPEGRHAREGGGPAGPVLRVPPVEHEGQWADLLPFYRTRGHQPLWLGDGGLNSRGRVLLRHLQTAWREGLDPADYGVGAIAANLADGSPRVRERVELLLSRGLRRFGRDMGAADPLAAAAGAGDLAAFLDSLAPSEREYVDLREALAHYRAIVARGGWPTVSGGPPIRSGGRRN